MNLETAMRDQMPNFDRYITERLGSEGPMPRRRREPDPEPDPELDDRLRRTWERVLPRIDGVAMEPVPF